MFNRVLVAEDHESDSISVRKSLEDIGIANPQFAYYCDHALTRIRNGLRDAEPFDLLITDLFFEEDGSAQQITSGRELIVAARQVQPALKVLVFSAEHRAALIESLYKEQGINGFVRKARRDVQALKEALAQIADNKLYFPAGLRQGIAQKNAHNFTDLDITIISLLARGTHQKDIPAYLQQRQVGASSLSSIEKRLSLMKTALDFSKNEQLVAFCKDMGII